MLAAAGCSAGSATERSPASSGGRGGGGAPVPVTTATVVEKAVPLEISAIGTGEPYSTVAVHAQITGSLTSVHFTEGDEVRAGQELFTLDRRPLEAALQQARANLDRDVAQAANARAQAQRTQDLADRGIAPRDQLDQARASAEALRATVAADRAAVESATVQLQYATIAAPLSGRTGALMVHEGSLVRANDTVPLVVINQISPLYESFAIPESRLAELKRYMREGAIKVEALPPGEETPATGHISFVDNQVDSTTGTIKIKAIFPNASHELWPGQFANVTLTLTTDPHAVAVPTTAVQTGQEGQYVFVVTSDGTAEMRPIRVARTSGDDAVVAEGLSAGETVVTDGQIRLVPGSRVSVKPAGQVAQ
jgi:multidrug efflux system membrane fusion protein